MPPITMVDLLCFVITAVIMGGLVGAAATFALMAREHILGRDDAETAGNVRVVMNAHGRDGHVWIDGQKVERLRAFEIKVGCNELNEIVLHVHAEKIEVDGVFDVTALDSEAKKLKVVKYPSDDEGVERFPPQFPGAEPTA